MPMAAPAALPVRHVRRQYRGANPGDTAVELGDTVER